MKAAILNSAMLDSTILHQKFHLFILTQLDDGSHLQLAILDSAILVFPLKLTHTSQDCFPPFPKKKTSPNLSSLSFAQNTSLIQSD